jgi:hypothetical protein
VQYPSLFLSFAKVKRVFILCGAKAKRGVRPPHCWGFCITKLYTHAAGRTPLHDWSARRRGHYLHDPERTQETNFHAISEIRTHDPTNQANADLHLRPLGDRRSSNCSVWLRISNYVDNFALKTVWFRSFINGGFNFNIHVTSRNLRCFEILRSVEWFVSYRCFWITYRFHIRGSSFTFDGGTDSLSRNVGTKLPFDAA